MLSWTYLKSRQERTLIASRPFSVCLTKGVAMDSGSDDLKEPLLEPREVHKMAIGLVLITLWTSALPPEIPLAAGAIYIGGCYVAVYLNKSGLFVRWVKPLAFWGLSAVGGMIIMSAQLTQSLPPERLNVYALMLLSLALSLFLCAMLATLIGDDLIRLIPGIERFVVSPRDWILRFPIFVMGGLYSLIAWETLNGLDRAIFQLGWTTLAKLGMLAVLLTAPGVALVLTAIFWQPACRGWNRLWRRTPNPSVKDARV